MTRYDHIDDETITKLVDSFYARVRDDDALGPIFFNAIGTTKEDWLPHLMKICRFWSSVILRSGTYHGDPMTAHKNLPAFDHALFDRWLALFSETLHEVFTEEAAEIFEDRAKRIAVSLKKALNQPPPN